jgi:hypothetical protein
MASALFQGSEKRLHPPAGFEVRDARRVVAEHGMYAVIALRPGRLRGLPLVASCHRPPIASQGAPRLALECVYGKGVQKFPGMRFGASHADFSARAAGGWRRRVSSGLCASSGLFATRGSGRCLLLAGLVMMSLHDGEGLESLAPSVGWLTPAGLRCATLGQWLDTRAATAADTAWMQAWRLRSLQPRRLMRSPGLTNDRIVMPSSGLASA